MHKAIYNNEGTVNDCDWLYGMVNGWKNDINSSRQGVLSTVLETHSCSHTSSVNNECSNSQTMWSHKLTLNGLVKNNQQQLSVQTEWKYCNLTLNKNQTAPWGSSLTTKLTLTYFQCYTRRKSEMDAADSFCTQIPSDKPQFRLMNSIPLHCKLLYIRHHHHHHLQSYQIMQAYIYTQVQDVPRGAIRCLQLRSHHITTIFSSNLVIYELSFFYSCLKKLLACVANK